MARPPARATIFDVASAAGVSITTVSHVFSGKRRVNDETRQRVLAAAEGLSYQPRSTARALAAGRTNTLALQIPFTGQDLILNSYFGKLLPTLSLAALDHGYSFLYVPPGSGAAFAEPLVTGQRVDAALLVTPVASDPFVRAVVEAGLPFVCIGRLDGSDSVRWVGHDVPAAASAVISHLHEHGYERPALISIPLRIAAVVDHERAFRAAAGERAPIKHSLSLSEGDAYDAALDLIGSDDPPDAIVTFSDQQSVGALRACLDFGLGVPHDVGVATVVDSRLAERTQPPLTAVDLFPERTARLAVDVLARLLGGEDPGDLPLVVAPRLVPRASTDR